MELVVIIQTVRLRKTGWVRVVIKNKFFFEESQKVFDFSKNYFSLRLETSIEARIDGSSQSVSEDRPEIDSFRTKNVD